MRHRVYARQDFMHAKGSCTQSAWYLPTRTKYCARRGAAVPKWPYCFREVRSRMAGRWCEAAGASVPLFFD